MNTETQVFTPELAIFASVANPVHEVMYFLLDNNIPFKVTLGSYKGVRETSFVVQHSDLETISKAGLLDGEESVLLLGKLLGTGRRQAVLEFRDGSPSVVIGFFHGSTRLNAEQSDGYSYCPVTRTYYVVSDDSGIPEITEVTG